MKVKSFLQILILGISTAFALSSCNDDYNEIETEIISNEPSTDPDEDKPEGGSGPAGG